MSTFDPKDGKRRTKRQPKVEANGPSMSAPQPMPGKPAATYSKPPKPQQTGQNGSWQSSQQPYQQRVQGWSSPYQPQQYQQYPQQAPSQGIPGGQLPQQQYGSWQQGYAPVPSQNYQQPTGRGWNQPYQPVQQPAQARQSVQNQQQNGWQGGYTVNQWAGVGYAPVHEKRFLFLRQDRFLRMQLHYLQ